MSVNLDDQIAAYVKGQELAVDTRPDTVALREAVNRFVAERLQVEREKLARAWAEGYRAGNAEAFYPNPYGKYDLESP